MKTTFKSWVGLFVLTAILTGLAGCFVREDPHHEHEHEHDHDDHVIIEHR